MEKEKVSGGRKLVLSVTLADCDVQTFRCGGAGGQHRDKTSNGVRIVHRESGAVGQATDDRSQIRNKRNAFVRMTETTEFKVWLRRKLGHDALDEVSAAEMSRRAGARVEMDLRDDNILVEVRRGGIWCAE